MFSYNSSISFDNSGSFGKILNELIKDLCLVTRLNNNRFPAEVVRKIVDYISGLTEELALSVRNRFFKVRVKKALSNFHILYFACWMLSDIASSSTFEDNSQTFKINDVLTNLQNPTAQQGPIFTMLLNSIDVDFINDKGSSTLHDNEPTQAVYLNSSKKENITLIGTYNNIFEKGQSIKIEDVVDVIENNRKLSHIFSSELFDDVDLNDSFLIFVEAQKELTSNMHFLECKLFHIQNDVFNLDISASTEKQNKYVCDIGFKKEFISKPIEEQIKLIMSNIEKIKKVTSKARYLLEFIEKYLDKDLLENKNAGVASEFSLSLDNIEEYFANYSNPDYIRQFTSAANIFLTFAILVNNMCQILKSESVA
jgi:dGTP triphosphohydrolase